MQSFQLKVNISNLRKEIAKDYFRYLDIFHKCLAGSLYLSHLENNSTSQTVSFENAIYNTYFTSLVNSNVSIEQFLKSLNTEHAVFIFLDTQIYLEQFIKHRHVCSKLNIYNLTITSDFELLITLKRF